MKPAIHFLVVGKNKQINVRETRSPNGVDKLLGRSFCAQACPAKMKYVAVTKATAEYTTMNGRHRPGHRNFRVGRINRWGENVIALAAARPTVMEKAFSQLAREDATFRPSAFKPEYPGAEALDAGGEEEGLHAITGTKPTIVDFDDKDLTAEVKASRIKETLDLLKVNEGKIIGMAQSAFEQKDHDIVPGHGYSIVKVEGDNLVLRNPWRIKAPMVDKFPVHNPKEDGTITISRQEFAKRFVRISHAKFK